MTTMGTSRRLAMGLGAVALLAFFGVRAQTQDVSLKPMYGSVSLKAGFAPDPRKVKLDAGGPMQTKLGGVTAWVANAPDYRLQYEAGNFALTIKVESKADTTLLVNLPNNKWVANDDGPNNGLNPLIRFGQPMSGQYDIWVGTLEEGATPPAVLFITELKQ